MSKIRWDYYVDRGDGFDRVTDAEAKRLATLTSKRHAGRGHDQTVRAILARARRHFAVPIVLAPRKQATGWLQARPVKTHSTRSRNKRRARA